MAQKQTKRGKTNQTSEWHDLDVVCEGRFQRSSVCCFTFLCFCQCLVHVSGVHMMIFIQCEFYISSGGWEGKTFHLGNAPNFCTHPNLWFYPPQKLGVGNFTCLKQSNFGASFFHAKHFWKAQGNVWIER